MKENEELPKKTFYIKTPKNVEAGVLCVERPCVHFCI